MSPAPERAPSIAAGALLFSTLAVLCAAIWSIGQLLWTPTSEPLPACCEVPIEIVEEGRTRIGCRGEPALESCGVLAAGDRVELGAACVRVPGGMSAALRLLQGLGLELNQASVEELQLIDGVGPALAGAIVERRDAHGPYGSVDELLRVDGIGPKTLERLRHQLTVSQVSAPAP